MKIVTAAQMREIEARSEESGVSTDCLMENAGLAVARIARRMVGPLTGVRVIVLIGPGNNGGDGLVTARHLQRWRARVTAYLCRDRDADDRKLADALDAGVGVIRASDDPHLAGLKTELGSAHLVVDAILGTGRARPISGVLEDILKTVSEVRSAKPDLRLLAVDLPTGVNCDTGEVDPVCVASDITVALGYPKHGHIGFPGESFTGRLEVADIGLPAGLDGDVRLELMTRVWARSALPERPPDSHKGTFGRAMIVAGSRNFLGAASLSAAAAGRVGAGLVTIAIPESLVSSVAPRAIEPTFLPLPESSAGIVSSDAAKTILESLDGYSALLVGCGLGQAEETRSMVEGLLLSGAELPPAVVDADGLNTLAGVPEWWEALAVERRTDAPSRRDGQADRRLAWTFAARFGARIRRSLEQDRRAEGRAYGSGPSRWDRDALAVRESGAGYRGDRRRARRGHSRVARTGRVAGRRGPTRRVPARARRQEGECGAGRHRRPRERSPARASEGDP